MSSSDEDDDHVNTIGNVPLDWYKDFDHIGYTIEGKKIAKRPESDSLEKFLGNVDNPEIARAIRKGLKSITKDQQKGAEVYDVWGDSNESLDDKRLHIPAPKLRLPDHADSYNPPIEYVLRDAKNSDGPSLVKKYLDAMLAACLRFPGTTHCARFPDTTGLSTSASIDAWIFIYVHA
ncbi:Ribosome biogenesis protein 1 [Phlyctochytrium bullatum]|nr:Ribosome biogenesis protein 1 [Phlyctochytrium bullatum]